MVGWNSTEHTFTSSAQLEDKVRAHAGAIDLHFNSMPQATKKKELVYVAPPTEPAKKKNFRFLMAAAAVLVVVGLILAGVVCWTGHCAG